MIYIGNELKKITVFLLPLRLFIGLILIQLGLGKFFIPEWLIGTPLKLFLNEQIQNGDIIFPFYQRLLEAFILPNAELFSGIILFAEVYCGIAIFIGCFTNLALIISIFLSLNLILVGNPNPSSIYIVCQAILLGMNSGAVLGFDTALSEKIHSSFLIAQPKPRPNTSVPNKLTFITAAAFFFLLALLNLSYLEGRNINPLEDTASSLAILSFMTSILLGFFAFRSISKNQPKQLGNESARLIAVAPDHSHTHGVKPTSQTVVSKAEKDLQKGTVNTIAKSINQLSKLLVPYQLKGRTAQLANDATEDDKTKQESDAQNGQQNNSSPSLHKLYFD